MPRSITVDHGTRFTSKVLDSRGLEHRIALDFTRPAKLTNNRHIDSFNAHFRNECLNVHQRHSLAHGTTFIEAQRSDCKSTLHMAP